MARVIQRAFEGMGARTDFVEITNLDLIRAGESQTIEFKSTARWNLHTSLADPKLEQVVVKTVCGFLNAEGGRLFIGVADDRSVLGIDQDLATLASKASADGYELFLRQLLETSLSTSTAATVRIEFDSVEEKLVCVVRVSAAARPIFAKPKGGAEGSAFWVRIGNQTKQLHGDDMVQYHADHWG